MAWMKIGEHNVLNANRVNEISIELYGDGTYYIKFSFNKDDITRSKRFENYEECLELFNRIWSAVADDLSIDVS